MKKLFYLLLITGLFSSCGPTLCDCVNYRTNDDEACRQIYKSRLGTEYPSDIRIYSVQKSCQEKNE
jgi:hypothetical protein